MIGRASPGRNGALTDEYTVLTASTGYEALRVLVERWLDLLITDVVMPGISGFELARQAKLMRPHLHVIYLSLGTGFRI